MRASVRATEQKRAMRAQVDGSGQSIAAIAEIMGVAAQTLSGWLDDRLDSHMPSRHIPLFLKATRNDANDNAAVANFWAGLIGHVSVRLPSASVPRPDTCQLADVAMKFAEMLRKSARAKADGVVSSADVEDIRPTGIQLASAVMAYVADLERQSQVGPLPRDVRIGRAS